MQGDILVDSMENVGSQFTITIPYIKEKKWS
jgi:signal transduction histidine kinase